MSKYMSITNTHMLILLTLYYTLGVITTFSRARILGTKRNKGFVKRIGGFWHE
jgi:hypothetical protein